MMISLLSTLTQKQQQLLKIAQTCVGKNFLYGATPEQAPKVFDCSSLTQYLYRQLGITLPRTTLLQAHEGTLVTWSELQIGDLLFFHGTVGHYNLEFPTGIGHVAMYLGENSVIQAAGEAGKVIVTPLSQIKKRHDLVVIKRLLHSKRTQLRQKLVPKLS